MDTQNLSAFLLVAETSSFSLAAEKLHITQPAVSKRVAALELQLGAALFDRIGRRTSLTEPGRALLPHAQHITRALLEATQVIKDLSGVVSGELSIATSHHIGLHRLPDTLRRFSTHYPRVEIDIEFMDSEQAYDLVMHGKAELAVVTLAPQTDPRIIAKQVWRDPLRFMVGDSIRDAVRQVAPPEKTARQAVTPSGVAPETPRRRRRRRRLAGDPKDSWTGS